MGPRVLAENAAPSAEPSVWGAEASPVARSNLVPGYSYRGFCAKVAGAGCAGYLVSLVGKRVLYYGRTGETHTEYFPAAT